MDFQRDPLKEESALQLFIEERGRKPVTQEEIDMVIKASNYSQEELPQNLKAGAPSNLGMQGIKRYGAQGKYESAQQGAVDFKRNAPTGINVLQDALKKKTGSGTPEGQSIGPSDMFKAAGLTHYGSLAASINARGKEIDAGYKKYTNWMSTVISDERAEETKLLDEAKLAFESYELEMDEYNRIADSLIDKEESLTRHQEQIDIIQLQHNLNIQRDNNQANLDASGENDIIEANSPFNTWANEQGLTPEQANNVKFKESIPPWFKEKLEKGIGGPLTIFGDEGKEMSRVSTKDDYQKVWEDYKKEGKSKIEVLRPVKLFNQLSIDTQEFVTSIQEKINNIEIDPKTGFEYTYRNVIEKYQQQEIDNGLDSEYSDILRAHLKPL